MLDELKDYINANNCSTKVKWWVYLLIKVGLIAVAFTIMALL